MSLALGNRHDIRRIKIFFKKIGSIERFTLIEASSQKFMKFEMKSGQKALPVGIAKKLGMD